MTYEKLNGHVTDDVMWPRRSSRNPSTLSLKPNISKTAGDAI